MWTVDASTDLSGVVRGYWVAPRNVGPLGRAADCLLRAGFPPTHWFYAIRSFCFFDDYRPANTHVSIAGDSLVKRRRIDQGLIVGQSVPQ